MSTAAGIAAVTAVLKDLLLNGLIDHDGLGHVAVTAQAPDRIKLPEEASQLNLFLYLITSNSGWRNAGLPSRDSGGALVSAPPLALDLHYLLSAYGTGDFHAELLLGYAMQLLHEMPVLSRDAIRKSLSPTTPVNGEGTIPAELRDLFHSGLADQIELIKITPSYLNTEEMFKLWMAFQSPYRPTAAYHVSAVLIDSKRQGKLAPPVRQRNLYTLPFAQPVIEQVLAQTATGQPFVAQQRMLPGSRVALVGKKLRGGQTRVKLGGQPVAVADQDITNDRVEFLLPADLLAGVQTVQVEHLLMLGTPPRPHPGFESVAVPITISPILSNVQASVSSGLGQGATTPRSGTITAGIQPPVGKGQRVILLLNELVPPDSPPALAYRFDCQSHRQPESNATSPSISVAFSGVFPAAYVVRVQVDGAESPLELDADGHFAQPQVHVP